MSTDTDVQTTDASAAPATDTVAATVPVDVDAEALKAFEAGVAAKDTGDEDSPAPTVEAKALPPVDQAAIDKAAADKAAADAAKTEPTAEEKEKAEAAAAVETEITALGLKEAAGKRFRELSARPTVEAVEKQLAPLRADSVKLKQWEDTVTNTGVTPTQWGQLVNYATLIGAAERGEVPAIEAAYNRARDEFAHWGKLLGKEAPGVDPLAMYPDLKTAVEAGDVPRETALELANARAVLARSNEGQQQRQQQQETQTTRQRDEATARDALGVLGARLKQEDPRYAEKLDQLKGLVAATDLHNAFPPAQWTARVEALYRTIKLPDPPKAPPTAGATPIRATGGASATQVREPKNDLEAFEAGIAQRRA